MITTSKGSLMKRRRMARLRAVIIAVSVLVALAVGAGVYLYITNVSEKDDKEQTSTAPVTQGVSSSSNDESGTPQVVVIGSSDGSQEMEEQTKSDDEILNEATRLAAMYDYDGAIELLNEELENGENDEYSAAIEKFEEEKSKLVKWADNTQITHIFFHTLVNDTDKAFDGDYDSKNYNQVMTTVDEFLDIIQEMYDRGYVLVSIYDIASYELQEDGTYKMQYQSIYLPEGKTPFVLSQDDVSYYEYMLDDGFPSRLVVTDDGKVTCEVENADGTVSRGSYDLIPLLDDFIEEHPDFSYKGAKGIIALTGYQGVLGYRTSEYNYGTADTSHDSYISLNSNIEEDRQNAKEVAEALKADGWLFATHGWGHIAMGADREYDKFKWDIDKWMEEVVPIIGETDIVIYPNGDDIGSWRPYGDENQTDLANEKYQYLESLGFHYFCNVDSAQYWVQLGSDYLRMGRRNLDGTRMYEAVVGYRDLLSDLFDAVSVFDECRPTPVEGVTIPEDYTGTFSDG